MSEEKITIESTPIFHKKMLPKIPFWIYYTMTLVGIGFLIAVCTSIKVKKGEQLCYRLLGINILISVFVAYAFWYLGFKKNSNWAWGLLIGLFVFSTIFPTTRKKDRFEMEEVDENEYDDVPVTEDEEAGVTEDEDDDVYYPDSDIDIAITQEGDMYQRNEDTFGYYGDEDEYSGDEDEYSGDEDEYSGDEDEYSGDEGQYSGDEGQYSGDEGEYSGDEGQYSGDEGEYGGVEAQDAKLAEMTDEPDASGVELNENSSGEEDFVSQDDIFVGKTEDGEFMIQTEDEDEFGYWDEEEKFGTGVFDDPIEEDFEEYLSTSGDAQYSYSVESGDQTT